MNGTLTCRCGTVLGIPSTGIPKDGLTCNWCGHQVTEEQRPTSPLSQQRQESELKPSTSQPKATTSKAPPRPWADDDDDDGTPYTIPQSEITTKKCLQCQKEIAIEAVLCHHCGHDERKREQAKRTYSPIDREWEQGWSLERRLFVFGPLLVINLITMCIGIFWLDEASVAIVGTLFSSSLQAFVLGTYPRLRIRRNKKGQADITTTWRCCFIPLPTQKVDWKRHEGVSVGVYDSTGISDWWIFFTLLSLLIIPALLWWWYAIHADRFFTALTRQNGAPETILYRGLREDQAKEIAQTLTDATGLALYTPL